jgi:hypothetical protein
MWARVVSRFLRGLRQAHRLREREEAAFNAAPNMLARDDADPELPRPCGHALL